MIWIAIAIVIVGFLIVQVLRQHNTKIEELKQKELETNPEYRKKKRLEEELESSQGFLDGIRRVLIGLEEELKEATTRDNKEAIERLKKKIKFEHEEGNKIKAEMALLRKQLG